MSSQIEIIWHKLIDEMSVLQDSSNEGGHLLNPISKEVYIRDTAFASIVFKRHSEKYGLINFLNRSQQAVDALSSQRVFYGVDEPIWSRNGWYTKKGSLAATGILLDALFELRNSNQLKNLTIEESRALSDYIRKCRVNKLGYAHDQIQGRNIPPVVLNTTAISLYLLTVIESCFPSDERKSELEIIWKSLINSQRKDGAWPYIHPGRIQMMYHRSNPMFKILLQKIPELNRRLIVSGDSSIDFVDAVHHLVVLNYLLKSFEMKVLVLNESNARDTFKNAWKWIENHINKENYQFDFSFEPKLSSPRFCNFGETTVYFLILSIMKRLEKLSVISIEDRESYQGGILNYISSLVQVDFPGIKPYEGDEKHLRNILPRVGESVTWKAYLLSDIL